MILHRGEQGDNAEPFSPSAITAKREELFSRGYEVAERTTRALERSRQLTRIPYVPLVKADSRPIRRLPRDPRQIHHLHRHVDRFLRSGWSHHIRLVCSALGVEVERVKVDDIDDLGEYDSVPVVVTFLAAGDELDGRVDEFERFAPLASGFGVFERSVKGEQVRYRLGRTLIAEATHSPERSFVLLASLPTSHSQERYT